MKKHLYLVVLLVIAVVFVFPAVATAAPSVDEIPPVEPVIPPDFDWQSLLASFGTLVGVGSAISLLVNIGKAVGIVKEQYVAAWVSGLNLLALAALLVVGVLNPGFDWVALDEKLATGAALGSALLAFILQLLSAKVAHQAVRGTPIIGTSFSLRR